MTEDRLVLDAAGFRLMVDAIPQLAWMADATGAIVWYNRRWYDYTGTAPEEMEGWGWQSVHDAETLPAVMERWTGSIAAGEPFSMTFPLRGADGRFRPFLTRVEPSRDAGGEIVRWFGTNTDVSELQETEGALRASEEALRDLNETLEARIEARNAALVRAHDSLRAINRDLEAIVSARLADLREANEDIQRFAYIVSHDLRAPLVNVMGFTTELDAVRGDIARFIARVEKEAPGLVTDEVRQAVDADLPEALGFIRTSTARMDRLINAILKLSREGRRVLTPERIAMRALVEGIGESLAHQLGASGSELVVHDLPDLVSDRTSIEQVFGNLIENAVKYLQPGRPGRIAVRGREEGEKLVYAIEDNGRGIAEKDFDRIFDLFRRAGLQDRPGEGIGLAHVRALVRRLGGTIRVASEPGTGSTFTLTLPKVMNPATEAA